MNKLLKTNSKEYLTRLNAYLIESIETDYFTTEPKTDKDKINAVYKEYEAEFCHDYNIKRYPNDVVRFSEWLMGLPSCINIEFQNYDILELAKKLHGVNELTEKQEDVILNNYWLHIADKFLSLRSKLNK